MFPLCRYLGPVQLETSSCQYNSGDSGLLEMIKSLGEPVMSLRFSLIIQKQNYPREQFLLRKSCCENFRQKSDFDKNIRADYFRYQSTPQIGCCLYNTIFGLSFLIS